MSNYRNPLDVTIELPLVVLLVLLLSACGPSGLVPIGPLCQEYGTIMCAWENECGLDNPCNDAVEEAEWEAVCLAVFEDCNGVADVDESECFEALEAMTCEDLVYPMECYYNCE